MTAAAPVNRPRPYDTLQHWFETGAADGFNIMPAELPKGTSDFVDLVVPILQQRGLFKLSYRSTTLRSHYLSVAVVDGRFDAITTTTAPDCNQRTSDRKASGAAVAVGIAAIAGAIALAHKSHNHDKGQHYPNDASDGVFDRGYRDGLYGQPYHNFDRSEPYTRGYEAGVAQRGRKP